MEGKVPFDKGTIYKCICKNCPVQGKSKCAMEKLKKSQELIKKGEIPKPGNFPGVYCSTGVASCKDIDTRQTCICGSCFVWAEFRLFNNMPKGYFCRDGKSR